MTAVGGVVLLAAIIAILRWMMEPSRRALWWDLLAEPGEEEGTLRRRLQPLAPRLRAKTGTVAGVNALAGVVARPDGRLRYFAVIVNHHLGSSSAASECDRRAWDRASAGSQHVGPLDAFVTAPVRLEACLQRLEQFLLVFRFQFSCHFLLAVSCRGPAGCILPGDRSRLLNRGEQR